MITRAPQTTPAHATAYRHLLRFSVGDLVYWLNQATHPETHIREWAMGKAETTRILIREIKQEIRNLERHA